MLPDSIKQEVSHSIAPAFSTSKTYKKGDIVSYNGKVYKFTQGHSAGAWNASQVSEVNAVDEMVSEATALADAAATTAKNASIAKTSTYQTADAIVTAAVAQAGTNAGSTYIAKTTTYQTADAIVNEAKSYTNNQLTSYSTTTQTNTLISSYVTNNAYGIKSGVSINANQVKIESGSTYLLLSYNGMTFSGGNASLSTPDGRTININGFALSRAKNYQNIYYYEMDIWNDSKHYFTLHSDTSLTSFSSYGYFVLNPNNQSNYSLRIKYNPNETSVCLYGDNVILGNTDSANYHILSIRADYIYWYYHCGQASSRDIKHNIRNMENVSQKIGALNPVRFVYDADVNEEEQVGLIYEDVVNIIPEICFEQNGEKAIDYIKLVPFLLKEVQRLQNEIEELRR